MANAIIRQNIQYVILFLTLGLLYLLIIHDTKLENPYQNVKIKDKYVIVIEHHDFFGEKETAQRIKNTANNMGWEVYVTSDVQSPVGKQLLKEAQPDFVISGSYNNIKSIKSIDYKRYAIISIDIDCLFKTNLYQYQLIDPDYRFEMFDGFLPVMKVSQLKKLQSYITSQNKKFYATQFFISTGIFTPDFSSIRYKNPRIHFSGANWDALRSSDKYKDVYQQLSNKGYAGFYGPEAIWKRLGVNWLGDLPNDGKSYLEKIATYQVALVLHSDRHLKFHIPTSRIFEAAAVGNVIISDRHQFIKDHFGNSVYYINESASADNMTQQIDDYMDWINQNPEQAMQMAKQAYQVYLDKFTLEQSLIHLAQMHEAVLANQ